MLEFSPPDTRLVGRFDFIIQVVQDDVVDEFIPSQDGSDLAETTFSHLHTTPLLLVMNSVSEKT